MVVDKVLLDFVYNLFFSIFYSRVSDQRPRN
jgi:hypothetical protein